MSLSQTVRIPWFPDPPCIITVAEALVQVAMHSQHHRGQCMTRLKDFGGQPQNVDWIIWLWKQKPVGSVELTVDGCASRHVSITVAGPIPDHHGSRNHQA